MKKYFLLTLSMLVLSASCTAQSSPAGPYVTPLSVGSQKIFVQVVSSPQDMNKGLSNRKKLRDDQGMLFDFRNSKNEQPRFCMKDMLFDLDLIWIKNNKVVGVTKDVRVPIENRELKTRLSQGLSQGRIENYPTYSPPSDVDMVLEVNAHWSDAHKIKTGDEVRF